MHARKHSDTKRHTPTQSDTEKEREQEGTSRRSVEPSGAKPSSACACVTCVGASSDSSPEPPPAGFSVGFSFTTGFAAAFFAFSFFRENSGMPTAFFAFFFTSPVRDR
jgi:hypothetical protein